MTKRRTVTMLVMAMATAALSAQAPSVAIAPPAIRSPEVGADARVTFRISAPNAKQVTLGLEGATARPCAGASSTPACRRP